MNALREGRRSSIMAMIAFLIGAIFGVITNNSFAVYGGCIMSGVSAVFTILLTLLIDRNEKRVIKCEDQSTGTKNV